MKLSQITCRGLSAYATGLCQDDSLIYLSLIGSDSMVRGIAAVIVEKPSNDLKYYDEELGDSRYSRPKQRDGKYHMSFTKVSDQAIHGLVYHEALTPKYNKPDSVNYLIAPDTSHINDTLWTFLNNRNTPLLPDWKDTVCNALLTNYQDGISAWSETHQAKVGPYQLITVHVPEHKMDNLISSLVKQGQLTF
jgi:hypothetical protein